MIKVENLSKEYKTHIKEPGLMGSLKGLIKRNWLIKKALDDVSFEIKEAQIVGLLGANGAGKTTIAKILSGIISSSKGKARVLGFDPWKRDNEYRKQMALVMGQKASLWWDLPAYDSYLLLKEIYQISDSDFTQRIETLSRELDINEQLKTPIRKLSLGERMKAELIAALLHNPKVIFLDEPTIGLDITAQKAIRGFLLRYVKEHRPTIILTSHYMEDIEALCQHLIILKSGKIVFDDSILRLQENRSQDLTDTIEEIMNTGRLQ